MTQRAYDTLGLAGGLLVAAVFLVAVSIALLQPEGTSDTVLIAVWLWALPVIAICTGVGMAIARLIGRLRRAP